MATEASFQKQAHFLDRDGSNRDKFLEISPLFGQSWQQSRVFRNKPTFWTEVETEENWPTFWTEVTTEACFQNKPTQIMS